MAILSTYSPKVRTLISEQRLGAVLEKRYPGTHDFATDKALWQYTRDLKTSFCAMLHR